MISFFKSLILPILAIVVVLGLLVAALWWSTHQPTVKQSNLLHVSGAKTSIVEINNAYGHKVPLGSPEAKKILSGRYDLVWVD